MSLASKCVSTKLYDQIGPCLLEGKETFITKEDWEGLMLYKVDDIGSQIYPLIKKRAKY